MKSINLLPRKFNTVSAATLSVDIIQLILVAACVVLGIGTFWLQDETNELAVAAKQRQSERQRLEQTIKRANDQQQKLAIILDRQKSWQTLQAANRQYSQVLTDLAASMPATLRLTSVTANTDKITLAGIASDRNVISQYATNLGHIKDFGQVIINQTTSQADGIQFSIVITTPKQTATPSPKGEAR